MRVDSGCLNPPTENCLGAAELRPLYTKLIFTYRVEVVVLKPTHLKLGYDHNKQNRKIIHENTSTSLSRTPVVKVLIRETGQRLITLNFNLRSCFTF